MFVVLRISAAVWAVHGPRLWPFLQDCLGEWGRGPEAQGGQLRKGAQRRSVTSGLWMGAWGFLWGWSRLWVPAGEGGEGPGTLARGWLGRGLLCAGSCLRFLPHATGNRGEGLGNRPGGQPGWRSASEPPAGLGGRAGGRVYLEKAGGPSAVIQKRGQWVLSWGWWWARGPQGRVHMCWGRAQRTGW